MRTLIACLLNDIPDFGKILCDDSTVVRPADHFIQFVCKVAGFRSKQISDNDLKGTTKHCSSRKLCISIRGTNRLTVSDTQRRRVLRKFVDLL